MKFRPYQEALISAVVADLSAKPKNGLSEVVLAACPNAGKTIMSIETIQRLIDAKAVGRTLVLSHATVLLRDNYVSKLKDAGPRFTFAEYLPRSNRRHVPIKNLRAQVIVALPQSMAVLKHPGHFDLVVVDEAHLFYGEPMITRIIEATGATLVLLLTGTPAPFVARGLPLHAVSMLELYREGKDAPEGPWVADVRIGLLQSRYDVRRAQYNDDGEIKRGVQFRARQTEGTIDDLQKWLGDHAWRATLKRLGKTMMVCRSQAVARQVAAYLRKQGVSLALSTSDTDPSSSEVGRFQRDESVQLLVVVCRANIGFDYPNLGALIDMTGTINIDRIFQMFARTVRAGSVGANKTFIKLASADMFVYSRSILKASLLLSGKNFYLSWNGKNLNGVRVPEDPEPEDRGDNDGSKSSKPSPRLPKIDDGFLVFAEFLETNTREDGALIAGTTIGALVDRLWNPVHDVARHKQEVYSIVQSRGRPIQKGEPHYVRQAWYASKDPEMMQMLVRLGYKKSSPDLSGQRFGKLVIMQVGPSGKSKHRMAICRCDCGAIHSTQLDNLRSGASVRCTQCFKSEPRRSSNLPARPVRRPA